MPTLDPNRHATPAEASLLREHLLADEAAQQAIRQRAARVRTALHDAQLALKAAQEVVDSAQRICDEVSAAEHAIEERLGRVRGLLHPIRRLPDELLGMIFLSWFSDMDDHVVPCHASAVCQRWRRVALGIPTLWRCIRVDLELVTPENADSWADYISTFIERSRTVPLHVSVAGPGDAHVDKLWAAFGRQLERSATIDIDVSGAELPRALQSRFSGLYHDFGLSAPHLVQIRFSFERCSNVPSGTRTPQQNIPFFESAPLLKTFTFFDTHIIWPSTHATYPSVTEVEIYIDNFTAVELLDLFHHMPNMRRLNVMTDFFKTSDIPAGFSIRSKKLRDLSLNPAGFDPGVLTHIQFPYLDTATLQEVRFIDGFPVTELLQHTLCSVERLTLSIPVDALLVEGFWSLSELRHLDMSDGNYTDSAEVLLDALSRPHGQRGWLCPSLRTLLLSGAVLRESLRMAILQLARARGPRAPSGMQPPRSLRSIRFSAGRFYAVGSEESEPAIRTRNRLMEEELDRILRSD